MVCGKAKKIHIMEFIKTDVKYVTKDENNKSI